MNAPAPAHRPDDPPDPARSRRHRLRRITLITTGILAVGVSVAACGGDPSTPRVATGSPTTLGARPAAAASTEGGGLLAYSSCMRSHGVPNFPDPGGKGGIPKTEVIQAMTAVGNAVAQTASRDCGHLLPAGGSLSGPATHPVTAQDEQDYLNAAACMRSHGIANFPDPTFANGTVDAHVPSSIDQNSRQFTRAAEICTKLIPAGLPYSASSR